MEEAAPDWKICVRRYRSYDLRHLRRIIIRSLKKTILVVLYNDCQLKFVEYCISVKKTTAGNMKSHTFSRIHRIDEAM